MERSTNIRVTIESEMHYWSRLIDALNEYLTKPISLSDHRQSELRAAVTHFKTKLNYALASNPQSGMVASTASQLTKEDMTEKYVDSFTA